MRRSQRGFTLIEMMLALAIFAVLSLTGYQILQALLRNGEQLRHQVTRREEIARLFALLDRDLSQAMIPALDETMPLNHPAFISATADAVLQFTRRNSTLPASTQPRSPLQVVRWHLSGETLQRELPAGDEISSRFHGVQQVTLRYWSRGKWQTHWPAAFTLPAAVEVTLHTPDYGAIAKIILLSGER